MNCPKCGGTGFVPTNVFGVNGAIKCDFCDGTGVFITNAVEPMTNEEWLHTLNTEQLAEWIAKIVDCDCCPVKRKFCDDNPCKIRFAEWLKQPHQGE